MENQALGRAKDGVRRLLDAYGKAHVRQQQLAAALAKSREELERLKADVHLLQQQRSATRRHVDSLIARLEAMGLDEPDEPAEAEQSADVAPPAALESQAAAARTDLLEPKL